MALTKVTQHSLGNSAVTTAKLGTAPLGFANSSANVVYIAANGNVGIGTSTPSSKLHMVGGQYYVTGSTSTGAYTRWYNNAQTTGDLQVGQGWASGSDNIGFVLNNSNADLLLGTNGTERMRIDSSGRVTTPYQPAIVATVTSSKTIGSGTPLQFDSIVFNRNSAITVSATNSRFAAPITGYYVVSFNYFLSGGNNNDTAVDLRVNGTSIYRIGHNLNGVTGTASNPGGSGVVIFNLSVGDYIDIVGSGTKTILGPSPAHSFLSMYLLG